MITARILPYFDNPIFLFQLFRRIKQFHFHVLLNMQSISVAPRHNYCSCCYPGPNHLRLYPRTSVTLNSKPRKSHCWNQSTLKLSAAPSCSKEPEKDKSHHYTEDTFDPGTENHEFRSSSEPPQNELGKGECRQGSGMVRYRGISPNMWWTRMRAALGQRINPEAIACFFGVLFGNKQLVIPHVTVPEIRYIDWVELKNLGFVGVVFDKDNTITVPYSLRLWAPLRSSLKICKSVFGNNIAVFSNSAGLHEYDPDGRRARALENAVGIKVIRHSVKKPAGSALDIERHFGCESYRLIMVGDRPFTDIVYGNRNGFFTILTGPLSLAEEPFVVRQVRLLEGGILKYLSATGLMPLSHKLVPDPVKCIKDVAV